MHICEDILFIDISSYFRGIADATSINDLDNVSVNVLQQQYSFTCILAGYHLIN